MIGEFNLMGMSAPRMFTCMTFEKEHIFWVKSTMPDDRYKALFNWAKGDDNFSWKNWRIIVEYDELDLDGVPRNTKFIEIKEI